MPPSSQTNHSTITTTASDGALFFEEDQRRRKSLQDIIDREKHHDGRMVILTAPPDGVTTCSAKTSSKSKPQRQSATGCLPNNRRKDQTQFSFRKCSIDSVETALSYLHRFDEWDPFWEELRLLHVGTTSLYETVFPSTELIQRAAVFSTTIGTDELCKTVRTSSTGGKFASNDTVLLLRMLPKTSSAQQHHADVHTWPKGTLIQINNNIIHGLYQRKQQSHDDTLWKGLSRPLNVGASVAGWEVVEIDDSDDDDDNPSRKTKAKKLKPKMNHQNSVEQQQEQKTLSFELYSLDDVEYVYSLSLCRFRSVDTMYKLLVNNDDDDDNKKNRRISCLSVRDAWDKLIAFIMNQVAVVEVDTTTETKTEPPTNLQKVKCSVQCPISKKLMITPVRCRDCKHWQCFDLQSFLSINSFISGSRWRCPCCECFVSLQSLEICGLTKYIIEHSVVVAETRIEFCTDRTYTVLQPEKQQRKRKHNNSASPHGKCNQRTTSNTQPAIHHDVYEIL